MWKKAFQKIDNSSLVVFRIFFGIIFLAEAVGALALKWVDRNFIDTTTNFTFIDFEWLLHLQNETMYVVFGLMAVASIGVMLGYKYRFSVIALTVLWSLAYFGQKTSYNNHYYLMWLIGLIMCFLPANANASIDAKQNPSIKKNYMPQWVRLVFIIQVSCVYFYATIAKFYPDWLDGTVTRNMFMGMTNVPEAVQVLFKKTEFQLFIAYMGIAFDGLIVPALLWKRTRWFAIIASLIFHIFNSITLQIGVFPYFALSFCVFFFPPDQIRNFFFRKRPKEDYNGETTADYGTIFKYFFVPYLIIQILLPIRHWFIKGDVLWTEEAHRLSWRMMLRSRTGETQFKVIDKKTNERLPFNNTELLNEKQRSRLNAPDVIWQMAHKIKDHFKSQGKDVAVYAIRSSVSINSRASSRLIDPKVDLAAEEWSHFKHHDWVLDEKVQKEAGLRKHKVRNLKKLKLQK